MSSTSDPNELQPLTELANRRLQEQTQKHREFATSSKWGASAFALQLTEGHGFDVLMGFDLKTPLADSIQETFVSHGDSKEHAVRHAVEEWLALVLNPALLVHSDHDPHARLGETEMPGKPFAFTWRIAAGPLHVLAGDADTGGDVRKDLGERPLFERLNLGSVLPLHQEVTLLCVKLQLWRPAGGAGKL